LSCTARNIVAQNFTHFTELLERHEGIKNSTSAVTSILESEYILSPRVTKAKRKRVKAELKRKKAQAQTPAEARQAQAHIVNVEDARPRRSRSACFGVQAKQLLQKTLNGLCNLF